VTALGNRSRIGAVTLAWRSLPAAQRAMLIALGALLLLVQVDQPYGRIAWLHHVPTALVLLASPWLLRRWPLSTASLACIVGFLALHTIGGRWTYSAVPYDEAARWLTGTSISEAFGFTRNHYDRLVHLSYGLLAIVPMREALVRHFGVAPRVALYFAFESVFAVSALYEIFEWLLTIAAAGPTADAYNGQQGDIWDAQKDMGLAVLGAALMAGILLLRREPQGPRP
jgi:putative membrane protein